MMLLLRRFAAPAVVVCFVAVHCCAGNASAEDVRSQAVVNLTFDEVSGDAYDSAALGVQKDNGRPVNGASRVESPFWGQRGKQAMRVDAGGKQFVELADSPDLDRPDGLSFSLFYLSLHDLNDGATHGIIAKRNTGDNAITNYGINYNPKGNKLQVYVNRGNGYRIAAYDVRDTVGSRERTFLTATFEPGDAPAPDEDSDRDDLLIRLFVNGKLVTPASATKGAVVGSDAWLTDVDLKATLNDVPLTLGSTNAEAEFTSAVIDEFSLFDHALSPVEAAMLFVEVGGPDVVQLAAREGQARPQPPGPALATTSLHGLRIGATTRLTIRGRHLGDGATVVLPIDGLEQSAAEGSNRNQLVVDLTLPPDAAPGIYPLRVHTAAGISNAAALAVDTLPQLSATDTSPEKPADLPAAFSGMVSGSEQPRVFFHGTAGQRIVAEVETRRLGSTVDPVLEIKTAEGTPILIEWGKVFLQGDARAELLLPQDGLYFVELHDLEYKAPNRSPYRLRIGDLTTADLYFPPAVAPDQQTLLKPVGVGLPSAAAIRAQAEPAAGQTATLLHLPPELGLLGPAPALDLSDSVEVLEQPATGDELQTIDARFAQHKHVPITINGRIAAPGEEDRYLLQVTPGEKLNLSVAARSINSPLDGQLLVRKHPEGDVLASSDDRSGTLDPGLEYTVPEGVEQVVAAVRDLNEIGGPHYLYRLKLVPAGQPDFSLTVDESRLDVPQAGSATVRLKVNRSGYGGVVKLRVLGDDSVSITPSELPAEGGNRELFVTLTQNGAGSKQPQRLRIVGESVDLDPPLRRSAEVPTSAKDVTPPAYQHELAAAVTSPAELSIKLPQLPEALLKGLESHIDVAVDRKTDEEQAVRLTLMSTEPARPIDARDRRKGNKPLVRSLSEQFIGEWTDRGSLGIAVPLDVAQGNIDFVIRADVVPHAYSTTRLATVYTEPFRLPVRDAVGLTLDDPTFQLTGGRMNKVTGKLTRTAPFSGRVALSISGLPEGYLAPGVVVEEGQEQFELSVFVPLEEQAKDLPNVKLNIVAPGSGPILSARDLPLKVSAPAKAE